MKYNTYLRLAAYLMPCLPLTSIPVKDMRNMVKLLYSIVCNDALLYNVYCCRVPNQDKQHLSTFLNCHEVVYRYVAKYCSNLLDVTRCAIQVPVRTCGSLTE